MTRGMFLVAVVLMLLRAGGADVPLAVVVAPVAGIVAWWAACLVAFIVVRGR